MATEAKTLKSKEPIISEKDAAVCFGSGELKDCPFCGWHAISFGKINEHTKVYVYFVSCTGCQAQVFYGSLNMDAAREKAIQKWNARFLRS